MSADVSWEALRAALRRELELLRSIRAVLDQAVPGHAGEPLQQIARLVDAEYACADACAPTVRAGNLSEARSEDRLA